MRHSWTFSTQKSKQSTSNRASSEARIVFWMFSISCHRVREEECPRAVIGLPCLQKQHRTYLCCPVLPQTHGQHHVVSCRILPSWLQGICRQQLFPVNNEFVWIQMQTRQSELDLFRIFFNRIPHVKPVVPSGGGRHRRE